MTRRDRNDQAEHTDMSRRRVRIERLLFVSATLATTALTLGNVVDPKIPPFVGE